MHSINVSTGTEASGVCTFGIIVYNSTYAQCIYVCTARIPVSHSVVISWTLVGHKRDGTCGVKLSSELCHTPERERGREREREMCISILIYACRHGYVPTAQREALTGSTVLRRGSLSEARWPGTT